jgi:energy-converting hydrogenase Eha subunit G
MRYDCMWQSQTISKKFQLKNGITETSEIQWCKHVHVFLIMWFAPNVWTIFIKFTELLYLYRQTMCTRDIIHLILPAILK